jgi:hypothetical protein
VEYYYIIESQISTIIYKFMKKHVIFYYIDKYNNTSVKKKSKDITLVYAYILKLDFKLYIYLLVEKNNI